MRVVDLNTPPHCTQVVHACQVAANNISQVYFDPVIRIELSCAVASRNRALNGKFSEEPSTATDGEDGRLWAVDGLAGIIP
jgi:hypothetical protein